MGTGGNAIEARGLRRIYAQAEGPVVALDDLTLDIRQGEFFTLLGPSGCGKTTCLRLIAGFEMPDAGTISLEGRDITQLPPHQRQVNTVFQSYALFPHMSVAENVGFGLMMLGQPKSEVAHRVNQMLDLVQMSHLAARKPHQLSGGQQQRVALARALAPKPKVLLLDEPLSALDLKLRKEMQVELKRLQLETGITFVFVTHDQEEALTMSDRVAVMRAGRIEQMGSPRDIYTKPVNRFVAGFIGETNFIEADVKNGRAMLPGGSVPLAGQGRVTLAVRPEHVRLGQGTLTATVQQTVYFGTDSHVHLKLGEVPLVARVPAADPQLQGLKAGDMVALDFSEIRVLE
jgi:spermidine/putrescine transport system ATP-binding protein